MLVLPSLHPALTLNASMTAVASNVVSSDVGRDTFDGRGIVRSNEFVTVGLTALFVAAAGAAASWLLRGRKAASAERSSQQTDVSDPYRTSASTASLDGARRDFSPTDLPDLFKIEIPQGHSRMDFENMTLSPGLRLDTRLSFEKIGGSWWVNRGGWGRCSVEMDTAGGASAAIVPDVLYPVKDAETLYVLQPEGTRFRLSVQIEESGTSENANGESVAPRDETTDASIREVNRRILSSDFGTFRIAGVCVGMVESVASRRAGVPAPRPASQVHVYLDPQSGQILGFAHDGMHPRARDGLPEEMRRRAAYARLDLMAEDGLGLEDPRRIARFVVAPDFPSRLRPFLADMAGRRFLPLARSVDARRSRRLP